MPVWAERHTMLSPIDVLLWTLSVVVGALAAFVILVIIVLTTIIIRKAFEKPKKNDHNLIVRNPVSSDLTSEAQGVAKRLR